MIPATVRERLGLVPGDQLTIDFGDDRSIILRRPATDEIQQQLETGYRWLKATNTDLVESLHAARRRARKSERHGRRP